MVRQKVGSRYLFWYRYENGYCCVVLSSKACSRFVQFYSIFLTVYRRVQAKEKSSRKHKTSDSLISNPNISKGLQIIRKPFYFVCDFIFISLLLYSTAPRSAAMRPWVAHILLFSKKSSNYIVMCRR